MKLALHGHCYEFHFNRKGFKFWKCLSHLKGCQARVVSKENAVYPLELKHTHPKEAQLEGTISTPVMAVHDTGKEDKIEKPQILSNEVIVVSVETTPRVEALQLKDKMKQRFAALSLNLDKKIKK